MDFYLPPRFIFLPFCPSLGAAGRKITATETRGELGRVADNKKQKQKSHVMLSTGSCQLFFLLKDLMSLCTLVTGNQNFHPFHRWKHANTLLLLIPNEAVAHSRPILRVYQKIIAKKVARVRRKHTQQEKAVVSIRQGFTKKTSPIHASFIRQNPSTIHFTPQRCSFPDSVWSGGID